MVVWIEIRSIFTNCLSVHWWVLIWAEFVDARSVKSIFIAFEPTSRVRVVDVPSRVTEHCVNDGFDETRGLKGRRTGESADIKFYPPCYFPVLTVLACVTLFCRGILLAMWNR